MTPDTFSAERRGYRLEIERLRAAATEWQPIETAPKSGKWVLLWWEYVTDAPFVGYCVSGQWHAAPGGEEWLIGPTHWMPLPRPPKHGGQ